MGRVVVTEVVSLDGVAEAPGGEEFRYPNWSFAVDRGPESEQFKIDEALGADALLLGRLTYQGFADAWPGYEGELADKYNGMPKYVVSRTLTDPRWANTRVLAGDLADEVTRVLAGDLADEVTRIRDEVAGDISVAGSLRLVQALLALDLVDELHLMTVPILLGTGRRLFGATPDKSAWRLTEATTVGDGVLITVLHRAR